MITLTLHSSSRNASSQTIASASFTPTANSRLFVWCCAQADGNTVASSWAVTDSIDGATGWTIDTTTSAYNWVNLNMYTVQGILAWKDIGGSPSAMTVTLDRWSGGTELGSYSLIVFDAAEHNIGSPFAQARVANGAAVDAGGATPSDTASGTLTLGGAPTSGNAVVAMFAAGGDVAAVCSTPAGYSSLASQSDAPTHGAAFYHLDTTTAAVTSSDLGEDVGNWCGIIMEIAADAGGEPEPEDPPISTLSANIKTNRSPLLRR